MAPGDALLLGGRLGSVSLLPRCPTERARASSETGLLQSAIDSSAYQRLFLEQDLTLTTQSPVINVTFDQ